MKKSLYYKMLKQVQHDRKSYLEIKNCHSELQDCHSELQDCHSELVSESRKFL